MKSNKLLSLLALCLIVFISSCKKEETTPVQKSPEELLTNGAWKIVELRFNQVRNTTGQGTSYFYKRGVTGNVGQLDTESITFNADHTGVFVFSGVQYALTWQFSNAIKTQLKINLENSPNETVTWENIYLTETSLKYGEYFNTVGGEITSIAIGERQHITN